MDIYNSLKKKSKLQNVVMTIGTFDGVHLGHLKLFEILIKKAKTINSESVVITFDPHPQHVIGKGINPKKLLTGIDKKIKLIKKLGVDHIIVIPFDINFSRLTADEFLREIIVKYFKPCSIVIGHDHHFGYKKEGNIKFLNSKKKQYHFEVTEVKADFYKNKIISSTWIRELIESRNIKKINLLLGRKYSIEGTVTKGDGRGRLIGFPTANLKVQNLMLQIPENGVYLVQSWIKRKKFFGMCNIGSRPTFDSQKNKVIEVHIFNSKPMNLYDKELKIEFIQFLRDEQKFESKEDLIDQIKIDKSICHKYLVDKDMVKKGDSFFNVNYK
ncbi:MAG: hypothetical protein CMF96_05145 [Candidatus Marinimicrobia bacterium]|nr:hypothetical protein [Candidatus Neomarinimicrobiota bacterium]